MAQRRRFEEQSTEMEQDNVFHPRGSVVQPPVQSAGAVPRGGGGGTATGNPAPQTPGPTVPGPPTGPIDDPDPPPTAPKPPAPPAPPPKTRTYGNIPGLDTGKLQNETYKSYKYGDAARAFSSYVGGGGKVGRNDLQGLVDYAMREFGLKNAKAVGDDKIDFGDGSGPIDIILGGSDGLWWGQEGPGDGGGQSGGGAASGQPGTPSLSDLLGLLGGGPDDRALDKFPGQGNEIPEIPQVDTGAPQATSPSLSLRRPWTPSERRRKLVGSEDPSQLYER